MADLLKAVQTVALNRKASPERDKVLTVASTHSRSEEDEPTTITTPEDALEILRSRPNRDYLIAVLKYLDHERSKDFDVRTPGPKSAKIVNELVNTTVLDYWTTIGHEKKVFLSCLRSVAGISAVLARLRLSGVQLEAKPALQRDQPLANSQELISLLEDLLRGDKLAETIWRQINAGRSSISQQRLLWKEFMNTIASGKIISTVAQAEDTAADSKFLPLKSWIAKGSDYASWLGRNVADMINGLGLGDGDGWLAAAQLCSRAFSLGYSASIVDEIYHKLVFSQHTSLTLVHDLALNLPSYEQRRFLDFTLTFSTRKYTLNDSLKSESGDASIKAAATLISQVVGNAPLLREKFQAWLSDPTLHVTETLGTRRAALAAMEKDEEVMQHVMEANLRLFGESLFIKHAPMVQQEACAQVLLLSAGYVHRRQPMFVFTLARSSTHLSGTSNRLNASSPRARILGMWVSMAISKLVDKSGQHMNFDMEEVKTPEALAFIHLVHVRDTVGDAIDVHFSLAKDEKATPKHKITESGTKAATESKSVKSTSNGQGLSGISSTSLSGPRVIEILSEDENDDDLVPYAKPDSDPEDEDEDPTLVTRNKPRAPVYIRDLIAGLQDTENYERHQLAVTNAAPLIRRKIGFGKEVSDHALELGAILASLGDPFDIKDFVELRLQALIALLISDSAEMGPWLARQVFEGDYSLSQRATLLSVLGLGARELAGYKDQDELNPKSHSANFPSRKLPDRLHNIYSIDQSPVQDLARKLEDTMIQPLALQAADQMVGPNALKVRTFSSRMQVEKKRQKAIPNALAKVVAESFFFPLTGRWWQNVQAYGSSNMHFQPFLLSTYLKTLAIMLHASGPSTLSLPQMTSEFWDLLLSVRTNALNDVSVLEAVLFSLLTMLEINEDQRRIAEEHSRQLMETQEWVELVFEKMSGGDEEGERVRMLAASVLLKTKEVVEKYQRLLVGDLMDY